MRLVDAEKGCDKLDDMYTLGEIGRRERDDIATYMLENAMPVDAIPVSWLEDYEATHPFGADIGEMIRKYRKESNDGN